MRHSVDTIGLRTWLELILAWLPSSTPSHRDERSRYVKQKNKKSKSTSKTKENRTIHVQEAHDIILPQQLGKVPINIAEGITNSLLVETK